MKKRKNDKLVYYKSLFKQIPHLENEIKELDKKIKEVQENIGTIKSPSDWDSIRLENVDFDPHADKSSDIVWELTEKRHRLLYELERTEKILNMLPKETKDILVKIYIAKTHSYRKIAIINKMDTKQLQRDIEYEISKL